jgi:hypothetical protein
VKKFFVYDISALSFLALFFCLFSLSQPVHAQADSLSTQPITANSITSYAFTAQRGDSLSRIVRRALQLRAVTDQPTALYCENTIATGLGNESLPINQQVVIPYAVIDTCVTQAQSLTAVQRAAWQSYADTVDFNVTDVTPINNSSQVVKPATPESRQAPSAPSPSINAPASTTSPTQPSGLTAKVTQPKKHSIPTYWWYIAIATITLVYFVVGGPVPGKRTQR